MKMIVNGFVYDSSKMSVLGTDKKRKVQLLMASNGEFFILRFENCMDGLKSEESLTFLSSRDSVIDFINTSDIPITDKIIKGLKLTVVD